MAKRKAREAALEQSGSPAKKGAAADGQPVVTEAPFLKSKQKVLVLASRGITFRCAGAPPLRSQNTYSKRPDLGLSCHTCRHRHLLLDFIQLLPHSKKDAKLDTKSDRGVINEVADIKVWCKPGLSCWSQLLPVAVTQPAGLWQGCNNVLFFEARKHKDLYLWMAKCPDGPSVKFHVTNGAWLRRCPEPSFN